MNKCGVVEIIGFSHSDTGAYTAPNSVVVANSWYFNGGYSVGGPDWTVRRDPTWYGISNSNGLTPGSYQLNLKDTVSGTSASGSITVNCS